MEAKARPFTFIANEAIIRIPFFQRQYVWDQENWNDLLEDLLDRKRSHFLGSIILKQQSCQSGSVKEVMVIDGQQRLTTLSILLKALFDLLPDEKQKQSQNVIDSLLFFRENLFSSNKEVKIIHSRYDAPRYRKVIEQTPDVLLALPDREGIVGCYNFFYRELQNKTEEARNNLFNLLANNFNDKSEILVVIDLAKNEEEQTIFDTINSAGVRLSSADTIKNALFQRALAMMKGAENEVYSCYARNWEEIFLLKGDDACKEFWETQQLTGRLVRDNIEILLHSIAVIKGFFDPSEHKLPDLAKLYKEYIEELSKEDLFEFIAEIASYATLYRRELSTFTPQDLFEFSDGKKRLLHILSRCDITTFHPFLLSMLKKYQDDGAELSRNFALLEKYVIRQAITGKTTKQYNKVCIDLIKNPAILVKLAAGVTDAEVETALDSINNKLAALCLFWIELYIRHNDRLLDGNQKSLRFVYSLEHLLPQKWEEYWSDVPFVDACGNSITDPEQGKKERNRHCNAIGNMTLLGSALNTSLRNYSFSQKVEGEGRKKGIRYYNELIITKQILENYDSGDTVWDEKRISNRTGEMYDLFLKIW